MADSRHMVNACREWERHGSLVAMGGRSYAREPKQRVDIGGVDISIKYSTRGNRRQYSLGSGAGLVAIQSSAAQIFSVLFSQQCMGFRERHSQQMTTSVDSCQ